LPDKLNTTLIGVAPRRYIIHLDAAVKVTASDGESRVIGVGEVILVEHTTGKGRLS
jgi:hypothetical protein